MMMINAQICRSFIGCVSRWQGGPELLLPELVGLLCGMDKVVMPFRASEALAMALHRMLPDRINCVWSPRDRDAEGLSEADGQTALYIGTPTIVNDAALFPRDLDRPTYWNADTERACVRLFCEQAVNARYAMIVTGLGSGDIDPHSRLQDMGAPAQTKVIVRKEFEDFSDWLMVRDMR